MMGSPLAEASWNGVEGAYYAGAGGGELLWLLVSIGICGLALFVGLIHEGHSYSKAKRQHRAK